jgi:heterodisulfide reductase subunit C
MSLGLLSEDMEMLNAAQNIIEKLASSSPIPYTHVEYCTGCDGTCTSSCSGNCSGGCAGISS